MYFVCFVVQLFFVSLTREASAQGRFEAAAQLTFVHSGEFDSVDTGIGARLSWRVTDLVGADAEINAYPSNFPEGTAFSRKRSEGLFGLTAGPRLGRVRPFGKLRPGFVTFHGQPVACILIFPPPLSCQLAAGRTVFALDIGGGVDVFTDGPLIVRLDAGDRMLKYPGPAFRSGGRSTQDAFFSHDLRVSVGAGIGF